MTRHILLITSLMTIGLLSGCNLVYKIDIQQGNVLTQSMVDELRPGMSKRQVSLVLGTAAIESPFHQNTWEYVNTYHRRGERIQRKVLTLEFEDNRLIQIEGDYAPGANNDTDSDDEVAGNSTGS